MNHKFQRLINAFIPPSYEGHSIIFQDYFSYNNYKK